LGKAEQGKGGWLCGLSSPAFIKNISKKLPLKIDGKGKKEPSYNAGGNAN
jgi:hypothetical protein